MEPIILGVLSSSVYDMLKYSLSITGSEIKSHLKDWLIDEQVSTQIATEIKHLKLTADMSERAIEKALLSSEDLINIIQNLKQDTPTVINQSNINGDNIAGNKIVNN